MNHNFLNILFTVNNYFFSAINIFFFFSSIKCRKFSSETTLSPVLLSSSFRATPATNPPSFAAFWFSINPYASFLRAIFVVEASPSMVKMSSKSFMWSLRFSLLRLFNSLYWLGVNPNVAFDISAVNISNFFGLVRNLNIITPFTSWHERGHP